MPRLHREPDPQIPKTVRGNNYGDQGWWRSSPGDILIMKLSIIISTWNSVKYIKNCIDSIFSLNLEAEIIIIDSHSTDGTVEYLRSLGETVKFLWSDRRLTWSEANQIGLDVSQGNWVCLSNPDIIFNDSFKKMLDECDKSGILASAPQLVYESEHRDGLHHPSTYRDFMSRINDNGIRLKHYLQEEQIEHRKTWIMGASTRGNTLLQYYKINKTMVEGAIDKNPDKWGLRTVGTDIPVWSRTEAVNADNFLILPYHFLDEFREQEKRFLKRGGRFLVPLPKFRMVT